MLNPFINNISASLQTSVNLVADLCAWIVEHWDNCSDVSIKTQPVSPAISYEIDSDVEDEADPEDQRRSIRARQPPVWHTDYIT